MPVGIRLDDGEKVDMRGRQLREETAIVLEGARGDFDPAGASLPEDAQVISLGQGESVGIALSDLRVCYSATCAS